MGCFWKSAFRAIGNFFRENWRSLVQIAAVVVMCGVPANPICAGVVTGIVVGVTGGNLGQAIRAGFIAAVTAAAFYQVGELTTGLEGAPNGGHATLDFMSEAHRFNMAGHALVGCASAVASGGSCGAGALSAGAGSFASPLMAGWSFTAKLVTTSVIGGVASVAGGGKFGNGAMTAAFGYLFNEFQYSVSGGATLANILGFGVSVSLGVSIPDRWTDFGGYQLFGSAQLDTMVGAGTFAGWGVTISRTTSDGPLPTMSGDSGHYAEFDLGNGPAFSFSGQRSDSAKFGDPPSAFSVSPLPKIGQGYGVYGGVGGYVSGTLATPTAHQFFGTGTPKPIYWP